jgi:choline dehydrogenase-like flavoprotein
MAGFDYDVLIIGSGFGGSVAEPRAAEKGYRVGVMPHRPMVPAGAPGELRLDANKADVPEFPY